MRAIFGLLCVGAILNALPIRVATQSTAPTTAKVTLDKAAVVSEITTDQRDVRTPAAAGDKFLWVTTSVSGTGAQTFDLTKVMLTTGSASLPLQGVDSAWDGDPKQFSMIAPAHGKGGALVPALEETRSDGTVAFVYTPGKAATLKVMTPPASVCLLFAVPASFTAGQITGLGATPLRVPVTPSAPARGAK